MRFETEDQAPDFRGSAFFFFFLVCFFCAKSVSDDLQCGGYA
jgi:hypothetical protein